MLSSENWTLVVAIYAALVSTGLLVLRIWEHKLSAGWVKISTSFHPGTGEIPASVAVGVTNRGLGEVTVQRLDLHSLEPVTIPLLHGDLISRGPEFPFRMEARTSAVWLIDADRLKAVLRKNGWPYEVRGRVTLATGKRIWESVHRYTAVH